ncbi:Glucuronosyltransferase [Aphelenchoides besseyi]|nr:Glucuronosyltransferase [Aphelenchoides besseyi]
MRLKFLVLSLFLSIVCQSEGLKILLYSPYTSKSHINFMDKISHVLTSAGHTTLLHKYVGLIQTSCEHLLQDNTTIEMLRNEKFDIAMSEIMDPCGFMLMRKAGIKKSIALHASYLPIHWQTKFGLPASLSFVPGK